MQEIWYENREYGIKDGKYAIRGGKYNVMIKKEGAKSKTIY